MANLFGRDGELDRAERALARAGSGSGSLLLLKGEAGIGKSTLAREIASRAQANGVRVAWGRCWEGGGATPYWPWVQVFRGLGLGPFEGFSREQGGDSQQQRFQLFDTATRELTATAKEQPLAIVLDDLHSADLPSLLMLLFLARQLSTSPLLVVGSAREVEARISPEIVDILAKVARESEVISLPRLTRDDVAAWIAGSDGSVASADEVFQVTEGNPLFVEEVLRVGALGKYQLVSDGIKAVIDEHLRKLSVEARELLGVAAVLGREFDSRELAAVDGGSHDAALEPLRQACQLGVLNVVDPARFQFTHVLLRDRLYETLTIRDRCELHWKAGLLADAHGFDRATVAHHLLEGCDAGDLERAASSALGAAEEALGRLAFEAAVVLAQRGLALLGPLPTRLVFKLEMACGEGLIRTGSMAAGQARCVRAADLAKRLGWAEEQGLAALVYGSEVSGTPLVDPVMVRLLEEALAAIGGGDSLLGAKLGARLAAALTPPRSEEGADAIRSLARTSLAMARRLGDAPTLLYALEFARNSLRYMVPSEERFEVIREAVLLAQRLDHRLTLINGVPLYAVALLERGLRADADAALTDMVELDAAFGYPQIRWRLPMLKAAFAFFDGRLDESERFGDEALALAERAGSTAANADWATQRMALAIGRAEPAAVGLHAARVLSIVERIPWLIGARAWVLGAIGRIEEAKATLRKAVATAEARGFPLLMMMAEACVLLEDPESAKQIYEKLQSRAYGNAFFWGGRASGYVLGPTSRVLGDLARLVGRSTEARRNYEEAIELCRRIEAKPFLEISLAALERLTKEESSAQGAVAKDTRHSSSSKLATPLGRREARDFSLRREGDVWAVERVSGTPFRLKHSKGLSYLSELLAHPGQELHVLSLIGIEHRTGDAGVVLDARAKADYRKRLENLDDQVSQGEEFGDAERANRAREEIDLLASQLAGAVGLGGRDRRAASDVERGRINVQRRLKDAIESIGQCDAELGRYLAAAVKTGIYCSFTPL